MNHPVTLYCKQCISQHYTTRTHQLHASITGHHRPQQLDPRNQQQKTFHLANNHKPQYS